MIFFQHFIIKDQISNVVHLWLYSSSFPVFQFIFVYNAHMRILFTVIWSSCVLATIGRKYPTRILIDWRKLNYVPGWTKNRQWSTEHFLPYCTRNIIVVRARKYINKCPICNARSYNNALRTYAQTMNSYPPNSEY